MTPTLAAFRQSARRVFRLSGRSAAPQHRTSRVLAKQLEHAMGMLAVSLVAQAAAAALLIIALWGDAPHALLSAWGVVIALCILGSLEYYRHFTQDKEKVARIRFWLRVQLAQSVLVGLAWGFAGAVFPFLSPGVAAIAGPVTAVAGVALGSWPFYAMWLPGLTAFSALSLGTTAIALVGSYFIAEQGYATAYFFALIAVIIYAGMKLNALITDSILAEANNRKLLQRLARERNAAEAARRRAEEENGRRARFFRAANHDLRQPLQAMGIYLQILQMKKTPETAALYEQLATCSKSLSTLVEQILEVSRMEADDFQVKRELVSIPALLESLASEFSPVASEKGIRFSIRPLPLVLDTDPQLAARALRNLISNAIKYCSRPAGEGRVILAARRAPGGRVRLCVYDNGPGISKEERARLFESFFRGEAGKKGEAGFGLGLAIVRGIAAKLGASLSVGSIPGRGTVFRMEFGAAASAEPEGVARAASSAAPAGLVPLSARILYLEDNVTVSGSVTALLRSWGAEVVQAPFLDEALLARMKDFEPEALLTDFDLGEGVPNGIESLLSLSHAMKRAIPAVILTAVPGESVEREWQKKLPTRGLAEMPEILRKPVGELELNSALSRALDSGARGAVPAIAPMPAAS